MIKLISKKSENDRKIPIPGNFNKVNWSKSPNQFPCEIFWDILRNNSSSCGEKKTGKTGNFDLTNIETENRRKIANQKIIFGLASSFIFKVLFSKKIVKKSFGI